MKGREEGWRGEEGGGVERGERKGVGRRERKGEKETEIEFIHIH